MGCKELQLASYNPFYVKPTDNLHFFLNNMLQFVRDAGKSPVNNYFCYLYQMPPKKDDDCWVFGFALVLDPYDIVLPESLMGRRGCPWRY